MSPSPLLTIIGTNDSKCYVKLLFNNSNNKTCGNVIGFIFRNTIYVHF